MNIGYANIFVSDIEKAIAFYRDILGLEVNHADPQFGFASFRAGAINFNVAQTDDAKLVGRHTGLGFIDEDIDARYEELKSQGVHFEMVPTKQPWGGRLALFADPDGNIHYLDANDPH